MMRKSVLCLTIVTLCSTLLGATLFATPSEPKAFEHPLIFEPNHGQFSPEVKWIARARGYQMLITENSATFALWENAAVAPVAKNSSLPPVYARTLERRPEGRVTLLHMKLNGSHVWKGTPLEPTGGVSNYLVGNRNSWRTNIPQYARLKLPNVYDGVDMVFYSRNGDLEYDFIVAPAADPKQIRLAFTGTGPVRMDGLTGDLLLTTATGAELRTHQPKVYQETENRQVEVEGGYKILDSGEAAFTLASYDAKRPLVIDPSISFTTFLSGNAQDVASGVSVDTSGNSYVTGHTFSFNFPVAGGFGALPGKNCTITVNSMICPPYGFLTKLSPTGGILFSTLFGGSDLDLGHDVVAAVNSVYVTGVTFSNNFVPGFNTTNAGGNGDVFVFRIAPTGEQIDYGTVFGGGNIDDAYGLAVDSTGAAYVTGITWSSNFPTTSLAFQKTFNGNSSMIRDAFVTKLTPVGGLDYSTYLGGNGLDHGFGIAVDSGGFAYIAGITSSTNFPTVGPTYGSPTGGGTTTAFVTKMVPNGSGLLHSTTLGGGSDEATAIVVNQAGQAYITGDTASPVFPTRPAAFQITKPSPVTNFDAVVVGFTPGGQLLYSTYLGGTNGNSFGTSIALANNGSIYVGGSTSTTDFPGPQPITPNPTAGFLVKFPPVLNNLGFRIYLGAQVNAIATRAGGIRFPFFAGGVLATTQIHVAGFRFVPNSDVNNPANVDAFVVKVDDLAIPQFEPF